jgi:xylulose-5-phosphate/fructose-6-phosphate phosphoketolase
VLQHVKPRLLGHWGTTPGTNFIYAHLNRIIIARDRSVLAIIGPGHGGPALAANTYLEGSYTELYPDVGQDMSGMRRAMAQYRGGVQTLRRRHRNIRLGEQ